MLSENEAIEFLVKKKGKNGNFFLRYLTHFVAPDLDLQEYFEIKGLYVGINLLREEFGFDKNEKPGDFDLIIIPYGENKIFFERTGACEVKVVRPTRKKPLKNANSLGRTQLNGLIKDGFPFVGLMHLSMSEPLKDFEKSTLDYCTIKANSGKKPEEGKIHEDYFVKVKVDTFQWFSVDKQLKRLLSSEIPKYAALLCFGLTKRNENEFLIESVSEKFTDYQKGYFNPNLKEETIEKVRKHFKNNKPKYFDTEGIK